MYPGAPEIYPKNPVFDRPKIIKNLAFRLSDPTSEPGIGTGMAENPPILFLAPEDETPEFPEGKRFSPGFTPGDSN